MLRAQRWVSASERQGTRNEPYWDERTEADSFLSNLHGCMWRSGPERAVTVPEGDVHPQKERSGIAGEERMFSIKDLQGKLCRSSFQIWPRLQTLVLLSSRYHPPSAFNYDVAHAHVDKGTPAQGPYSLTQLQRPALRKRNIA